MTEKTHKYTTLKGLIRSTNQFSFYSFLTMRMCHKKNGWVKIKLSPDLKKQVYDLFAGLIGDFNLFAGLIGDFNLNMSTCGLFERLIINKRLKCEYVAGQDYGSELRYLRKLIKNEGC